MVQVQMAPPMREAAREDGVDFVREFTDAFNAADYARGRRITGQQGADLRRRPELFSLERVGATLAILARENPTALRALFKRLEAWAWARRKEPLCLLTAASANVLEEAEAHAAIMNALVQRDDATAFDRAIQEKTEAIASAETALAALQQVRETVRVVRKRTLIASGIIQRKAVTP